MFERHYVYTHLLFGLVGLDLFWFPAKFDFLNLIIGSAEIQNALRVDLRRSRL